MKAAKVISNVFSPPCMATIAISFLLIYDSSPILWIIGFILIAILPIVPVIILWRRGIVDLDVSERKLRPPLFALATFFYVIAAVIYLFLGALEHFRLALAYILVTLVIAVISLKWKISTHTAGSAGPTTALMLSLGLWITPLYVITLLLIVGRVLLGAHTWIQSLMGALVAVLITVFAYILSHLLLALL